MEAPTLETVARELGFTDMASLNGTRRDVERVMAELAAARRCQETPGVGTTIRAGYHRMRALGIAVAMPAQGRAR